MTAPNSDFDDDIDHEFHLPAVLERARYEAALFEAEMDDDIARQARGTTFKPFRQVARVAIALILERSLVETHARSLEDTDA